MTRRWIISLVMLGFVVISTGIAIIFNYKDEKPKIVAVLPELSTDHSKIVKAGLEKGFADLDIDGKVIAPDTQNPASKQMTILKDILKQKPDALIVTPTDSSATIHLFQEYKKRNIPVLLLNQDTEWEDQTAFIGTDHLQLGKMTGQLLATSLQPGDQVVFMVKTQADLVEKDWIKAAKKEMANSGVEVIRYEYDESSSIKSVTRNVLENNPDIKGIFVTNENTALDILKVLEEKRLNIPIVGTHNVSIGTIKAVEEERLSAIVNQNGYDMGYLSVVQASKVINGEPVDKRIDSGFIIITKYNAESVLDFYEDEVPMVGSKND